MNIVTLARIIHMAGEIQDNHDDLSLSLLISEGSTIRGIPV